MMAELYSELSLCVLCRSANLRSAVPLSPMPLATPNFRLSAGISEQATKAGLPLDLYQCRDCGHVQVGLIGNPDVQYRDYVYETSMSLGLAEHFRQYAAQIVNSLVLAPQSLVVEIGSNDGTLLSAFAAAGMRVQGVDPARRIAQSATARGIPTIGEYFDETIAELICETSGHATAIVANNVIANVAILESFMRGVELLLAEDGVFVFETQYGGDVVERVLLDTVYHEHVSYFLTRPAKRWLAASGLELIDVMPVDTKGGSFRLFAQKRAGRRTVSLEVARWVAREERSGMFAQPFFDRLCKRIADVTAELHTLVDAEHKAGRSVGGFGVSVGTSTLLAQLKLQCKIDFLVDDDARKEPHLVGPGYRIPVITREGLGDRDARLLVVFAWRYLDSIKQRCAEFLERDGILVVPVPQVSIVRAGAGSAIATASGG